MPESDRKQAERKASRPRGGVLRRGRRKDEEDSPSEKNATPAAGSGGANDSAPAKEGEERLEVSSLLETTSEDVKQLLEAAGEASKKIREAAQTEADGPGAADGGEATSLIGRINTEVQQVLESADEAAEKIREEARSEARHLIEEARRRAEGATTSQMDRVSQMTDQVLGELSAVQGQLQSLQSAFDRAIKAMSADLGVESSEVWRTQQNGAVESEEESAELRSRLGKRPRRKSAEQPEGVSEGARLLALQQLMAGVEPDVIEERLKNEFGIEDPRPVLDWMGLHATEPSKSQRSKKS